MPTVFEIADRYVESMAALDPFDATMSGIPGHDAEATDYSPAGDAARAALDRDTLASLDTVEPASDPERLARDYIVERLGSNLALYDAQEHLRTLNILFAPQNTAQRVFSLMPHDSDADWEVIARRLRLLPQALQGIRATFDEGLRRGLTAARRQALECAAQCEVWSGKGDPVQSRFRALVDQYTGADTLKAELTASADDAAREYAAFAAYLRDTYAPKAETHDGVGADRYALLARRWLGMTVDLRETYEWGWQNLAGIQSEMQKTAERIQPGAGVEAALDLLKSDPARRIDGVEPYREWLQALHDQAVREVDGVHFDVPQEIRRIEVLIPPPGGDLAPHYTPPSEDFSRPGRTWWPTGSATSFPKWDRVSIAYHEGVPGHHFQLGVARVLKQRLSRMQQQGFVSGHGEGWALYAERLMAELGFLEEPDYYMGMLATQAFRAVRVIVDIGMHLDLPIPAGEAYHPGEKWTPDLAHEFLVSRTGLDPELLASEVVRYLGVPGQAISYKVGEREWLAARDSARARFGADFDLKRFHMAALSLGPLPLEMLRPEIERALEEPPL